MTSILKVDRIEAKQSGGNVTFGSPINPDGFSSNYRPGEVIEEFTGVCDGQSITVTSGTYTLPNVTAVQNLTETARQDVTGSVFTYTPPVGTSRVYYSLEFAWDNIQRSGISNYVIHHSNDGFVSDDNVVIDSGRNVSVNYIANISDHAGLPIKIQHTFVCNASTEVLTEGKFTSWTSPKTIKITAVEHGSSYDTALHQNPYFETPPAGYVTADFAFVRPTLTIKAIA